MAAPQKNFTVHFNRSELTHFEFDNCKVCEETIVRAKDKSATQVTLEARPNGDIYSRHVCRGSGRDE